jgi:thioredoxin 1
VPTLELTEHTFEETVVREGVVLVDFWAAWCAPCQRFAPVFEQASLDHPEVIFGKVDTEAERVLAASAGISAIPTLMAFRDGLLVHRESGALSAPELERLIAAVEDLDMDDVRARFANARASA